MLLKLLHPLHFIRQIRPIPLVQLQLPLLRWYNTPKSDLYITQLELDPRYKPNSLTTEEEKELISELQSLTSQLSKVSHLSKSISIPKEKLTIQYARSSGPGGQNVNKVNTKCDVRFHVWSAEWLPSPVRQHLMLLQKNRINQEGEISIQCSVHRTQEENLEEAMQKLKMIIEEAFSVPKWRQVRKEGRSIGGNEQRLKEKRMHSDKKQQRTNWKKDWD